MSSLVVNNLSKSFKARKVVKNVSLNVDSGEVVGLLGPNGAGKTTSFYMIVGLIKSDSGTIELDAENITGLPMDARARKGIGYLPQEASVFRKLTVEENILGVLEVAGFSDAEQRLQKLESLLYEFHISHIRTSIGMSLSGGERRRVEIARALATEPRFILLDEPFAGVDPISVGDIQTIVEHLKNVGIGVLITDHNVQETLRICDRAYIVNEGTIIASGEPSNILENDTVRRVYLGDSFTI